MEDPTDQLELSEPKHGAWYHSTEREGLLIGSTIQKSMLGMGKRIVWAELDGACRPPRRLIKAVDLVSICDMIFGMDRDVEYFEERINHLDQPLGLEDELAEEQSSRAIVLEGQLADSEEANQRLWDRIKGLEHVIKQIRIEL